VTENVIQEKSYGFALRIVRLYNFFSVEKKEFVLSKPILIAGTYVGAHVKAAQEAESKSVFIHEMSIALQKASEIQY
jgi:four helix bundle protein